MATETTHSPVAEDAAKEQYHINPNYTTDRAKQTLDAIGNRLNQLSVVANGYREKIMAAKTSTKKEYYRKKLNKIVQSIIGLLQRRDAAVRQIKSTEPSQPTATDVAA